MSEQPERMGLEEILHEAMALPPEQRKSFLDRACGANVALRSEIESLLLADMRNGNFLRRAGEGVEVPFKDASLDLGSPARVAHAGMVIGPYRLRREIGSGGHGSVWLAERRDPTMLVAVKVLATSGNSRTLLSRFLAERQTLARLRHENIARLIDVGQMSTGAPAIIMEYVDGPPITRCCDGAMLPLRERLKLFLKVCDAVSYAHAKGVIHRDLKPSNILVHRDEQGRWRPVVIDFGVAKSLLGPGGSDASAIRPRGIIIGTIHYMSPEQAADEADVDTRSDIYSLGVILYELLTGSRPLDALAREQMGDEAMRRTVCEIEPIAPSEAVGQVEKAGTSAQEIAVKRASEPKRLAAQLRGDLDWIALKALRHEREDRYASVLEFAADIARHLRGEAVLARPRSVMYVARKWVRRNRAASVAGTSLVAGGAVAIITLSLMLRERSARLREVEELGGVIEETLKGTAWREAGEALQRRIIDGEADSLSESGFAFEESDRRLRSVTEAIGRLSASTLANFMMDRAVIEPLAVRAERLAERQPEIAATLLGKLAHASNRHDNLNRASDLYRRQHDLLRQLYGEGDPRTLEVLLRRTVAERQHGNYDTAEAGMRQALALAEATLGARGALTIEARGELGGVLLTLGRVDEAAVMLEEASSAAMDAFAPTDLRRLIAMSRLALLRQAQGRKAEACATFDAIVAPAHEAFKDKEVELITLFGDRPALLVSAERWGEAEAQAREIYEIARTHLGDDHSVTLSTLGNLAQTIALNGRADQALGLLSGALRRARERGVKSSSEIVIHSQIAHALHMSNRLEEAEVEYRETCRISAEQFGPNHPETLNHLINLAALLSQVRKMDEANEIFKSVFELAMRLEPEGNPRQIGIVQRYCRFLMLGYRLDEFRAIVAQVSERYEKSLPEGHEGRLAMAELLVRSLYSTGELGADLSQLEAAVAQRRAASPPDEGALAGTLHQLGLAYLAEHRYDAAEKALMEVLEIRTRLAGPDHPSVLGVTRSLALLRNAQTLLGSPRANGSNVGASRP